MELELDDELLGDVDDGGAGPDDDEVEVCGEGSRALDDGSAKTTQELSIKGLPNRRNN